MSLGNVPLGLKAAKPYVKIGLELYKTRPVVAYHCFSYAITLGLQSDYKSDKDLRSYLMTLMDYVEKVKQALIQQEDLVDSVTKDLEGQMVVESAANDFFEKADGLDRANMIDKKVMKMFYTAHLLFCVLQIFNEPVSEESMQHKKYAAWKSTYLMNCFRQGITPIPGPVGGDEEEEKDDSNQQDEYSPQQPEAPHQPDNSHQPQSSYQPDPYQQPQSSHQSDPAPQPSYQPPPQQPAPRQPAYQEPASSGSGYPTLSFKDKAEAEKMCKFAGSSISFDDTATAIDYLEKALRLLKTGKH